MFICSVLNIRVHAHIHIHIHRTNLRVKSLYLFSNYNNLKATNQMLAGFKKTIQVLNVCVLLNGFKIIRNDVIIIRFMNEFFNSINYK